MTSYYDVIWLNETEALLGNQFVNATFLGCLVFAHSFATDSLRQILLHLTKFF